MHRLWIIIITIGCANLPKIRSQDGVGRWEPGRHRRSGAWARTFLRQEDVSSADLLSPVHRHVVGSERPRLRLRRSVELYAVHPYFDHCNQVNIIIIALEFLLPALPMKCTANWRFWMSCGFQSSSLSAPSTALCMPATWSALVNKFTNSVTAEQNQINHNQGRRQRWKDGRVQVVVKYYFTTQYWAGLMRDSQKLVGSGPVRWRRLWS